MHPHTCMHSRSHLHSHMLFFAHTNADTREIALYIYTCLYKMVRIYGNITMTTKCFGHILIDCSSINCKAYLEGISTEVDSLLSI